MDFDSLLNQLRKYVKDIEEKFIKIHLENKLAAPDDYNLDVKSYCILSHAAFEEFMETIALQVMSKSIKKYNNEGKISKPIISLMHFKSNHDNYLDKDTDTLTIQSIEKIFDYNRQKLEEIKSNFSKEVHKNHGVSLKYLRKLLMPISLDIPTDVKWSNSLAKLADERGSYAHKYLDRGKVKQSISPEDAQLVVVDCIELCNEVVNRAKLLLV